MRTNTVRNAAPELLADPFFEAPRRAGGETERSARRRPRPREWLLATAVPGLVAWLGLGAGAELPAVLAAALALAAAGGLGCAAAAALGAAPVPTAWALALAPPIALELGGRLAFGDAAPWSAVAPGALPGTGAGATALAGAAGLALLGWIPAALTAPRALVAAFAREPLQGSLLVLGLALGVSLAATEVARVGEAAGDTAHPDALARGLIWLVLLGGSVAWCACLRPFLDASGMRRLGFGGWLAERGAEALAACTALAAGFVAARLAGRAAEGLELLAVAPLVLLAGRFAARHLPPRVPWLAAAATAVLGFAAFGVELDLVRLRDAWTVELAARTAPGGAWAGHAVFVQGGERLERELGSVAGVERLPRSHASEPSGDGAPIPGPLPKIGDLVLRSARDTPRGARVELGPGLRLVPRTPLYVPVPPARSPFRAWRLRARPPGASGAEPLALQVAAPGGSPPDVLQVWEVVP